MRPPPDQDVFPDAPDGGDDGRATSARRGRRRQATPQTRLSRLLSYVLRHRPDALELTPDDAGWVCVDELIDAIARHRRLGFPVDRALLAQVVTEDARGRFELASPEAAAEGASPEPAEPAAPVAPPAPNGGPLRIRARYGHTFAAPSPGGEVVAAEQMPEFLFIGSQADDVARSIEAGRVLPRSDDGEPTLRLVASYELARRESVAIAERAGGEACVMVVDAARAARAGDASFSRQSDDEVYRCASIPRSYLLNARRGYREQHSAGGVVVRGQGEDAEMLLIATQRGRPSLPRPPSRRQRATHRWELPKGKIDAGEQAPDTALREIREETGITAALELGDYLGSIHYAFRVPEGVPIFKTVYFWLVRCGGGGDDGALRPAHDEGLVAVEWVPAHHATGRVAYGNLRPIVERAFELIEREADR